MATLAAVRGVLPEYVYPQEEITQAFLGLVDPDGARRAAVERIHAATGVRSRHLALPLTGYGQLDGFAGANDTFVRVGLELACRAVTEALDAAGLDPADVDVILSTSVTGLAVPSLDARLASRLGLRPDVKRVPVFGLGCVAGAAGLARLADQLRGDPDAVAVLVSVELCSLTVQADDASMANVVASGLFGDGAAAAVLVGARRAARLAASRRGGDAPRRPRVVATRSRLYPDTERAMGWEVTGNGFRIVLSTEVPDLIDEYLADDVEGFLSGYGLKPADVGRWICHPGGPKVLTAVQRALHLDSGELQLTWDSLARVGNLSSSSVLHVLADTLAADGPPGAASAPAVLLAMGPGFCSELVLLEW